MVFNWLQFNRSRHNQRCGGETNWDLKAVGGFKYKGTSLLETISIFQLPAPLVLTGQKVCELPLQSLTVQIGLSLAFEL